MWIRALENESRGARPPDDRRTEFEANAIEIRMFRVVEGESILLTFDRSRCWLIDGGNGNGKPGNIALAGALQTYIQDNGLTLEACVASHSHFDHIGAYETLLASGSGSLANRVTVFRSQPAWDRGSEFLKRYFDMVKASAGQIVDHVLEPPVDEVVELTPGLEARFIAGTGESEYFSLLMQLTFGRARLFFTGDTTQGYERRMIRTLKDDDAFRADVMKISHHGSSHATSAKLIETMKPAFAFASDSDDPDHRLERDTRKRILCTPVPNGKRRIFNTAKGGDIVIETDGRDYRGGVLYRVTRVKVGELMEALGGHHPR